MMTMSPGHVGTIPFAGDQRLFLWYQLLLSLTLGMGFLVVAICDSIARLQVADGVSNGNGSRGYALGSYGVGASPSREQERG